MKKGFIKACIVSVGIAAFAAPAMSKGPHGKLNWKNSNTRQYQCQSNPNGCNGQGMHRFGDGTQPRPQDGTGFGFKRGLQNR